MKYLIGILIILGAALVSIAFIPDTTSATRTTTFDTNIDQVWAVYTDFASQPDWRNELSAIEFEADEKSWTETVEPGGVRINIAIVELDAPNRLVLKTGSENSFEGIYTAEFESTEHGTIGTFKETSTTTGYLAKLIRFLFVNQGMIIEKYTENAKAEIARRK